MKISITVGHVSLDAELNQSPTARKVAAALPLKTEFSTWGEEIYFPVPVQAELDDTSRETVELGDLGYWPTGSAFCIFFGQTPMSTPDRIVPAGPVNIIGHVHGDVSGLKEVMQEKEISVEPLGS